MKLEPNRYYHADHEKLDQPLFPVIHDFASTYPDSDYARTSASESASPAVQGNAGYLSLHCPKIENLSGRYQDVNHQQERWNISLEKESVRLDHLSAQLDEWKKSLEIKVKALDESSPAYSTRKAAYNTESQAYFEQIRTYTQQVAAYTKELKVYIKSIDTSVDILEASKKEQCEVVGDSIAKAEELIPNKFKK